MRVRSASWIFSAQVASLVISFPMSILLARVLGPSGKGTLSIVQLIATMSAIFLSFGLGQALVYYSARREASGEDAVKLAAGVAGPVVGLLLLLTVMFGRWLAQHVLHTDDIRLVYIGVLAVFPVLMVTVLAPFLIGSGSVRAASLINIGSLVFQFACYGILSLLHVLTAPIAVVIWLLAAVGSLVAVSRLSWGVELKDVDPGILPLLKRLLRYGLASWVAGMLYNGAMRQDVFLLAYFKTPAAVGVYSVAVTFAELCFFVPNALGGVMMPKVAAEGTEALELSMRLARTTWPAALLVGIVISAAAFIAVPFLFGKAFSGAVLALIIILPGVVAMAASSMPSAYLNGIGHPRDWTIAAGANMATNLISNIIFIPLLGVNGAALSSSISYTVGFVVIVAFFARRTGVSPSRLLVPQRNDLRQMVVAVKGVLSRA